MVEGCKANADLIAKSLGKERESLSKDLQSINSSVRCQSSIHAVDLLTDEEVDELRTLIELGDDAPKRVRDQQSDEKMLGMYSQLLDLGFLDGALALGGELVCFSVSPKASWAVARREYARRLEEERLKLEEDRRKQERRFQRRDLAAGFLIGLATPLLVSLIRVLASSAGLPLG